MGAKRRHARTMSDDPGLDDDPPAALAQQRVTGPPGRDATSTDRGPGRLNGTTSGAEAGEFLRSEHVRDEQLRPPLPPAFAELRSERLFPTAKVRPAHSGPTDAVPTMVKEAAVLRP
jgi:hypothetical protein